MTTLPLYFTVVSIFARAYTLQNWRVFVSHPFLLRLYVSCTQCRSAGSNARMFVQMMCFSDLESAKTSVLFASGLCTRVQKPDVSVVHTGASSPHISKWFFPGQGLPEPSSQPFSPGRELHMYTSFDCPCTHPRKRGASLRTSQQRACSAGQPPLRSTPKGCSAPGGSS